MYNSNTIKNIIYTLIIIFIIVSCARPQTPTGGPKDEKPPALTSVVPAQESLLFKGNSIAMKFDEYVQLNKIKGELNITPKINEDYEYKIKKTTITFTNLKLEDSTTYTFNFGEGIVDVTEKNPAENLIVIFSTGNYLDSLNISGNVKDILSGKPTEKALVALYDVTDTLDIFTGRAKYTVKANENGNFNFTNLKNGKYHLYVVNDTNKNFKCEPDKESFGYYPGEIDLENPLDSLKLYIRKRNFKPFKITNLRTSGKFFEVRTNKYIIDYNLSIPSDSSITIYSNKVEENQNIRIYNTFEDIDSLQVKLNVKDTINQTIDTVFYLKFQESSRKSPDFNISLKDISLKPDNIFRAKLVANKPILTINSDSIYVAYDSTTFDYLNLQQEITWNDNRTAFTIEKQLDPEKLKQNSDTVKQEKAPKRRVPGKESFANKLQSNNVSLKLGTGSIISVEKDTSQQIIENLQFTKSVNYAIINLEIVTTYSQFITQLLDKSGKIIEEKTNQTQLSFKNLDPGEYKIRILIDLNKNGKWDEGTVENFIAPEPVYHLDKTISLRANWEVNEIVTIPDFE